MGEDRWLLAYRYPDMHSAGEAYELCRDLVFGFDIDASAYRVQISGVAHVVVIGEGRLPQTLRDRFKRSCRTGASTELPAQVVAGLFERRESGKLPGFWERRSR